MQWYIEIVGTTCLLSGPTFVFIDEINATTGRQDSKKACSK